MRQIPDFIVIGAARSGTTAIHGYLRQSQQIFMPEAKEPNFFAYAGEKLTVRGPGAEFINNSITDHDAYRALFKDAPENVFLGEASPLYLYEPKSAQNIARLAPKARLIAILRNPIEQAYSHFLYAKKQAIESEQDFARALELEEERLAKNWQPLFGYSRFPRYGKQLERFFDVFPRDQLFIRTYDDFRDDPAGLMRDMTTFIGLSAPFTPDMSERKNAGGLPKNRFVQDFLMRPNPVTAAVGKVVPKKTRWAIRDWLAGFNVTTSDTMSETARTILRDRLSEDIKRTAGLLDRDLSHWLA